MKNEKPQRRRGEKINERKKNIKKRDERREERRMNKRGTKKRDEKKRLINNRERRTTFLYILINE